MRIHVLSLVVAFSILSYLDRHEWFYLDDWDFLILRGFHNSQQSIWFPHNEHWTSLPILLYRLAFTLAGLHSWWLLTGCLLLVHLALAHLIWRTSIRIGVNSWMATALTAVFLLLGAGWENLVSSFQISFVAPVAFGFAAILAEGLHFRPRSRMVLIWMLTVAALMCSGIGITMTFGVGAFLVFQRRMHRAAVAVSVPLATYLAWYVLVGHKGLGIDHVTLGSLLQVPSFVWAGLSSALGTTFGLVTAGPFLLLALLGWALVTVRKADTAHATGLALALTAVALYASIGPVRSQLGVGIAATPRYIYVAIALLLPAIGLALTQLVRWHQEARLGVFGIILIVLVSNLGLLHTGSQFRTAQAQADKTKIVADAAVTTDGDRPLAARPVPSLPLTSADLTGFSRRGLLPSVKLTVADQADAVFAVDVAVTALPIFGGRLRVTVPPTANPGCAATTTLTGVVPSGGGSLIVASSITQAASLSLRTAARASSSPIAVTLFPGYDVINVSAPGTTITVSTAGPPGVGVCSQE
ncbi:MAG: hypothetical protein M3137_15310 [Actinomycetota bacterium]|nr:hypothetical protein [Actinomycetota bacterium]